MAARLGTLLRGRRLRQNTTKPAEGKPALLVTPAYPPAILLPAS